MIQPSTRLNHLWGQMPWGWVILRLSLIHSSLPEDPGGGRPHVSQGFQGGLGFFLLDDADDRVDHHDGSDDNGLGPLLQQGGEQGRTDENEDHRVQQLSLIHI